MTTKQPDNDKRRELTIPPEMAAFAHMFSKKPDTVREKREEGQS